MIAPAESSRESKDEPRAEPVFVQPDRDGLEYVAAQLRASALAIIPTDTVYGLCALATDEKAVEKLFAVKGRSHEKSIAVLVADIEQAEELVDISSHERALVQKYWPGKLTIVFKKLPTTPEFLGNSDGTLAIRQPSEKFVTDLAALVGPLAVTSANISGESTPDNPHDCNKCLLCSVEVVVDGGVRETVASTVVKVDENAAIRVLRPGGMKRIFG